MGFGAGVEGVLVGSGSGSGFCSGSGFGAGAVGFSGSGFTGSGFTGWGFTGSGLTGFGSGAFVEADGFGVGDCGFGDCVVGVGVGVGEVEAEGDGDDGRVGVALPGAAGVEARPRRPARPPCPCTAFSSRADGEALASVFAPVSVPTYGKEPPTGTMPVVTTAVVPRTRATGTPTRPMRTAVPRLPLPRRGGAGSLWRPIGVVPSFSDQSLLAQTDELIGAGLYAMGPGGDVPRIGRPG